MASTEWAAWIQAIGSIIAIFGAAGIAIWQSNKQSKNSLELLNTEHKIARVEVARALLTLSTNSLTMIKKYREQLSDRTLIHNIGMGITALDLNELRIVEGAVHSIPLHTMPHQLVTSTMIVHSLLRQFREHVEQVLKVHRQMDADQFNDFFNNMLGMQKSLELTCKEIQEEIDKLEEVS